jgi:hypothetical protein
MVSMLDKNKPITFMYVNPRMIAGETDVAIHALHYHQTGVDLVSIKDVIEDNKRYEKDYHWGADEGYMMCKEGMYIYHEGSYLQVCKY